MFIVRGVEATRVEPRVLCAAVARTVGDIYGSKHVDCCTGAEQSCNGFFF